MTALGAPGGSFLCAREGAVPLHGPFSWRDLDTRPTAAFCGDGPRPLTLFSDEAAMTVIALVVAGNLLLAATFSLIALAAD